MEILLEENGRRSIRHETIGLMSNITDGNASVVGIVEDISANGMRVSHIPSNFDDTAERCYSIMSVPGKDYTFVMHPRWAKLTNHGMYKMVGFELENIPDGWKTLVNRIREDKDPFIPVISGHSATS